MPHPAWIHWTGTVMAAAGMTYTLVAMLAVAAMRFRHRPQPRELPRVAAPVTILKPLCGDEHELYECLRSFCEQDHPDFQIVFGVSDPADPAIAVVKRLQREFPAIDLALSVDTRQHGTSRKVSNLINMMRLARHDHLVISDSDVRVQRNYLNEVVGPLQDPAVGIVTCAYRGFPRPGLWSVLGAMFINEWFMPSVSVAAMSGSRAFAFGVTIAMRREVLARVGGFEAIANQLADDYRLGELTRRMGLRTVLSDVVVETCVDEPSFGGLVRHELRWLRTIRAVRPLGYLLSFVTFSVPVAVLGCLLAAGTWPASAMLAVTVLGRMVLYWTARSADPTPAHLFALPLRDGLSLTLWACGFLTSRVHWRNDLYRVHRDGSAQLVA